MRALAALVAALVPCPMLAQANFAADLFRVGAAPHALPTVLAAGPSAPLWNPAGPSPAGARASFGLETVHAPADLGVNGVVASLTHRRAGRVVYHLLYGRMGVNDLARTETSPEALAGGLRADATVLSVGAALPLSSHLVGGAAARLVDAQLADRRERRVMTDLGIAADFGQARIAAATRFLDPRFTTPPSASYSAGSEVIVSRSSLGDVPAEWLAHLGGTWGSGERVWVAGVGLRLDRRVSARGSLAREGSNGDVVWRSRLDVGLVTGRYSIALGRDGGVHGFGATYRFAITVDVP